MKYPRLNGADLYVARLGATRGAEKQQLEISQEAADTDTCELSSSYNSARLEETSSTGSLHDELKVSEAPVLPSVSSKTPELFDRSTIRTSRPCYRCVVYMHSVGIKRVFWTNDNGQWEGRKVHELVDAFANMMKDKAGNGMANSGAFVTKHEVLMLRRTMGS